MLVEGEDPTNEASSTNGATGRKYRNGHRDVNAGQSANGTRGTITLPSNCKIAETGFDKDVIAMVERDDQLHMVKIVQYCCYKISNKNSDVKPFVKVVLDPTDESYKRYDLYVSFAPETKFTTRHLDDIRAFDFERISMDIWTQFNAKHQRQIMCIPINASSSKVDIEDASLLIIHLQNKRKRIVFYDEEADVQGSEKRKRSKKERDNEG